jgi:hypothetical protein
VDACTTAQIQTIFNDCLGGGTCPEASAGSALFGCFSCIFTSESAPSWGPTVLSADGVASANFGGCLTLLEPCNTACAATFENLVGCEQAACATNCPVTASAASFDAFNTCADTVDDCDPGGCFAFFGGTECASEVTGAAHPGSVCFASPGDFEGSFLAISAVFCGGT